MELMYESLEDFKTVQEFMVLKSPQFMCTISTIPYGPEHVYLYSKYSTHVAGMFHINHTWDY